MGYFAHSTIPFALKQKDRKKSPISKFERNALSLEFENPFVGLDAC